MHLGAAMVASLADKAKGKAKANEEANLPPSYKSKVQHVIEGKFLKTAANSRSKSEVSVQA
tara:strand:+ start:323 stop:505 length:183 start_codon:yes stop_codon:yes gene_type:complete